MMRKPRKAMTVRQLKRSTDVRFDRVGREMRQLRQEMRQASEKLRQEMRQASEKLRREMRQSSGELRHEMQQLSADTRRHFDVVAESMRDDFRIFADAIGLHSERLDGHDGRLAQLERRF